MANRKTPISKYTIVFSKVTVACCILTFTLLSLLLFSACKKDNLQVDTGKLEIIDYNIPSDLPDYALKLEWYGSDGSIVNFNYKWPTVILFNGENTYNETDEGATIQKDSYTLPGEIFNYEPLEGTTATSAVLSSYSKDMNLNLSAYWRKLEFNVGIFHYENFAIDTEANLSQKAYDKNAMSYINTNNERITENSIDYTIVDAFVMEWLKLMRDTPIVGTVTRLMEVRFIGNSAGANVATEAAVALHKLREQKLITPIQAPARVSIIHPYLNNAQVDYLPSPDSLLSYNNKEIEYLSNCAVALELIENDAEFFMHYENNYSGLVPFAGDIESVGAPDFSIDNIDRLMLGDTGDSAIYKNIQKNCAYLYLRETYSSKFPDEYKEKNRVALDWYLYSMRGTDNSSVITSSSYSYARGTQNTAAVLDDIRKTDSTTYPRYGISAWTPTVYTLIMRGRVFNCTDRVYSTDTWLPRKYTLTNFQAEAFQMSDCSGVTIAGYVFWRRDGMSYINLGADSRIPNVTVKMTVEFVGGGSASTKNEFTTTTDEKGYYQFVISDKVYFGNSVKIEIVRPRGYEFATAVSDVIKYDEMSVSTIGESGKSVSLSSDAGDWRFQYIILNCGLDRKID